MLDQGNNLYKAERICFYFRFIFGEKKGKRYDISNLNLQMKYFIAFFLLLAPSSIWTKKMHLNIEQKINNLSKKSDKQKCTLPHTLNSSTHRKNILSYVTIKLCQTKKNYFLSIITNVCMIDTFVTSEFGIFIIHRID